MTTNELEVTTISDIYSTYSYTINATSGRSHFTNSYLIYYLTILIDGKCNLPNTLEVHVYAIIAEFTCEQPPPSIRHASIIYGDYQTIVVYKCAAGYAFTSGETQTSVCLSDNSWSLQELCLGKGITIYIIQKD